MGVVHRLIGSGVRMLNDIWRILVSGSKVNVCVWIFLLALDSFRSDPNLALIVGDVVMCLLNIWSYEYKRRNGVKS